MTPTITGTGEAGATVTLMADTDAVGGVADVQIGTTVVQSDGTWSVVSTETLPEETIALSATQTDPSGNESPASNSASIEINTTTPDAPEFVSFDEATGSIGVVNSQTPTITGTGEDGATVVVLIDADGNGVADTVIGTVTVDGSDGSNDWAVTPDSGLVEGVLAIVAYQTSTAGNISESAKASIEIDLTVIAPTIDVLPVTK